MLNSNRAWRINVKLYMPEVRPKFEMEIMALCDRAKSALGESFDIHDSHDELSGLVAIPLASLKWRVDQRINSWVVTVD
jgi:hypothetical protein